MQNCSSSSVCSSATKTGDGHQQNISAVCTTMPIDGKNHSIDWTLFLISFNLILFFFCVLSRFLFRFFLCLVNLTYFNLFEFLFFFFVVSLILSVSHRLHTLMIDGHPSQKSKPTAQWNACDLSSNSVGFDKFTVEMGMQFGITKNGFKMLC